MATPATEADLVDLAGAMTAAQLETLVRAYRRARPDVTDPDRAPYARRGLTYYSDDDGSLVGTFCLAPEDGAVVVAALQAAAGRSGDEGRSGGADTPSAVGDDDPTLDRPAASRADALVAVAGAYLDRPPKVDSDDAGGTSDRYVVHIIAEQRVLTGSGGDRPDGVCQVDDGPGLAPDVVRRLACDAPTVTVVEDQFGHVLDVGRRTRRVNRALRRALDRRDGGCQFPGCNTRRTQAHHVDHWIDGGPTSLANLILLCARHHHRHHDGGFTITPGPAGRWTFTRADGRAILPAAAPPTQPVDPDPGIDPAVTDCTPDWEGGTLDLSGIVDGLLRQEGLLCEAPPPAPSPDIAPGPSQVADNEWARPATGGAYPWADAWRDPWTPDDAWPGE